MRHYALILILAVTSSCIQSFLHHKRSRESTAYATTSFGKKGPASERRTSWVDEVQLPGCSSARKLLDNGGSRQRFAVAVMVVIVIRIVIIVVA
jgi:hypothetical protein